MHKYELSRAADKDLTDLYVYTFREFGEAQADAYFASLEESLARLSENPQLGIDVGLYARDIAVLSTNATPFTIGSYDLE